MKTECKQTRIEFQGLARRRVVGKFDGGALTSDAGGLLLGEVEARCGVIADFAQCFTDHRDEESIEHTVAELVAQRVYGLALGYEDLNDHDDLRHDWLLATLVGKLDPTGGGRVRERDRGKALAGKSTLNRLELTPADADGSSRYKKIVARGEEIERFFVELFLRLQREVPERLVLDLDATDDPLHGAQQGRFFHGYYKEYCYLPLYIFCGDDLLSATLRPSNIDAPAGAKEQLERIVAQIRERWPEVSIVIRADSGFCREELMAWCEGNDVDYIFGLAKNERLKKEIEWELAEAKARHEVSGQPARLFKDFRYRTRKSWSRERRVIGKAEHLAKGSNPRFVVTSIAPRARGRQNAVRKRLLRARRDGKPDQGTAARPVRRSHQQRADALQSAAPVVLLGGLCAGQRLSPAGTGGHRNGTGAMRHDSRKTVQDRRPDQRERAAHPRLAGQRLPLPTLVHCRLAQPARPGAASLLTPPRPSENSSDWQDQGIATPNNRPATTPNPTPTPQNSRENQTTLVNPQKFGPHRQKSSYKSYPVRNAG